MWNCAGIGEVVESLQPHDIRHSTSWDVLHSVQCAHVCVLLDTWLFGVTEPVYDGRLPISHWSRGHGNAQANCLMIALDVRWRSGAVKLAGRCFVRARWE